MTGEQLRKARIALGLTQESLADRLGVTGITVSRWERGKQKPSALVALAIRGLGQ